MSILDLNRINYKFNYLPENNNTYLSGMYGILLKNSNATIKSNTFNMPVTGYTLLTTDNSNASYSDNKISGNLAVINNNSFLTQQNNNFNKNMSLCVKHKDIIKVFNNSFINLPKLLNGSERI